LKSWHLDGRKEAMSLFKSGKIVKVEKQTVTVEFEDGTQTNAVYTTTSVPPLGTEIEVRVIKSPDNMKR
jgi:hypothetical protein